MKRIVLTALLAGMVAILAGHMAQAADFKIGIMQDKPGAAKKFGPLMALFKAKGLNVRLPGYSNYPDAAMKFER